MSPCDREGDESLLVFIIDGFKEDFRRSHPEFFSREKNFPFTPFLHKEDEKIENFLILFMQKWCSSSSWVGW